MGVELTTSLQSSMFEGCRLRTAVALFRDVANEVELQDYAPVEADPADPTELKPRPVAEPTPKTLRLAPGTRVLVDVSTACHDPTAFPDPETVRLDRPLDSYLHYGWGPHQCAGLDMSRAGLAAAFKVIVGLNGLQATPGARGKVMSTPARIWRGQVNPEKDAEDGWLGLRQYMTADQSSYWPVPSAMRVQWRA